MKNKFNKWQEKWLKALESGEYAQSKGALCNGNGFCCLGVACEILGIAAVLDNAQRTLWNYAGHTGTAPLKVVKAMALRNPSGIAKHSIHFSKKVTADYLASANDSGATFKQIARAIRKNPSAFFTNFTD